MFRAGILGKFKKLYIKILNKQFISCSVISGFMHVTEGHSKKLIFFRFRLFEFPSKTRLPVERTIT